MTRWSLSGVASVAALLFPIVAGADETAESGQPTELGEIVVTSTRFARPELGVPVAIGAVEEDQIQLGRQQLSLQESLLAVPGLVFQNRHNYAQDLRISIRGFGARANFGIRGIKIITDGIPNTLPDGQGNVDDIDLGSTRRIEVIRGPSSSLYGSAAGGVINIFTEDGPASPFVESRLTLGTDDLEKYQLKAGGQYQDLNYLGSLSYLSYSGYRDQSATRSTLLNTKFRYDLSPTSSLTAIFNAVDSPLAQDPGALNAREVKEDRRQAAPRALLFDTGEALTQQKLGLVYRKSLSEQHSYAIRGYYVDRDFDNYLPFDLNSNGQGGSVDLNRSFFGAGGDFATGGSVFGLANSLIVGFEIDAQRDQRKRYVNEFGSRGALTTNQDEDVTGYAVYIQDELSLREALRLTLGLRYDTLEYRVTDKVGRSSGSRTFDHASPMVGLLWSPQPAINLYGNISTSFEPPTTTELANPEGPTGFNQSLEAQQATNYEIGAKGLLGARARYELALFHIDIDDELVPFELAGSGQTFFENAGKATRDGIEATLTLQPTTGLTATLSYTYSDFTFDSFGSAERDVFDGNRIPGVPDHQFYADMSYFHSSGFFVAGDLLYVGRFFADNANQVRTDPYTLVNLRLGYLYENAGWEISPYLGVNNLFDEEYNDNVRLNANFGRYFEPAPELNVYGGIRVRYSFGS